MVTNPISEDLGYQWVVVDDLADFNDDGHNTACYTARKPGGGDKGSNFSSITDTRLIITICSAKYYEDVGRSVETNIMEWIRIKHFKPLIQIKHNLSEPESLPELNRTMPAMKLMDLIRDHLQNNLGIRNIPLPNVIQASIVPEPIRDIIPTLP